MMAKFYLLLFLGVVSFSACKTTAPTPPENKRPRKAMLTYQNPVPLLELWEKWTPVAESHVPELFSTAAPFDYWQVKDQYEIEQVWSVLSTLLSALRSQTDDVQFKLAIRSTLTILEPTPVDRTISTLDFTFLTSTFSEKPIDRWEGVAIRWFKKNYDASPTITLLLSRRAMSPTGQFDRVYLWIESGFSELPAQSVTMHHDKEWKFQTTAGLTFDFEGIKKQDAKIYVDTLAKMWSNYTNASYVRYDKMDAEVIGDHFGKVKLREIEMVFKRTQFPPKFNF